MNQSITIVVSKKELAFIVKLLILPFSFVNRLAPECRTRLPVGIMGCALLRGGIRVHRAIRDHSQLSFIPQTPLLKLTKPNAVC
jgi:hypothetical protein